MADNSPAGVAGVGPGPHEMRRVLPQLHWPIQVDLCAGLRESPSQFARRLRRRVAHCDSPSCNKTVLVAKPPSPRLLRSLRSRRCLVRNCLLNWPLPALAAATFATFVAPGVPHDRSVWMWRAASASRRSPKGSPTISRSPRSAASPNFFRASAADSEVPRNAECLNGSLGPARCRWKLAARPDLRFCAPKFPWPCSPTLRGLLAFVQLGAS